MEREKQASSGMASTREELNLFYQCCLIISRQLKQNADDEIVEQVKALQSELLKRIASLIHGKEYRKLIEDEQYDLDQISDKEDQARYLSDLVGEHFAGGKLSATTLTEIYKICIRVLLFFKQEGENSAPVFGAQAEEKLIQAFLPALGMINLALSSRNNQSSPSFDKNELWDYEGLQHKQMLKHDNLLVESGQRLCKVLLSNMCQLCKEKVQVESFTETECKALSDHFQRLSHEHETSESCVQVSFLLFLREMLFHLVGGANDAMLLMNIPEQNKKENQDLMHVIAAIHRAHSEELNKTWNQVHCDWIPKDFFEIFKQEANNQLKVLYGIIEQLLGKSSLESVASKPAPSRIPSARNSTHDVESTNVINRLHHGKPTCPTRRLLVEDYRHFVKTVDLIKSSYKQMQTSLHEIAEYFEKSPFPAAGSADHETATKVKASLEWILTDLDARIASLDASGTQKTSK
ncbi:hypothetical protein Ciccas_005910 [Cichlidogyrus casuarinus]|uniref:Uncharacterized protein n=1 Tax=Cichlidogyrus casuarinus TaxID=1844966 RepID=A0ABD2Q7T7_9PLAT